MGGLSQGLASLLVFVLLLTVTVEAIVTPVTQGTDSNATTVPQELASGSGVGPGVGETTVPVMPEETTTPPIPSGFLVQPESVITFLNSGLVEYSCTSDPQFSVSNFYWRLNGQSITLQVQTDRGIAINSELVSEGGFNSTLTIVTLMINDGVVITCGFEDQNMTVYTSDPARLDLQFVVLGFEQTSYSIAEGAGTLNVCANITQVNLIENMAINARVFSVERTTFDYAVLPFEGFILGLGLPGATSNCVEIVINDDSENEGPEMYSLTMNTTLSYVVVSPNMVDFTILDDDDVQIGFEMTNYMVNERDRMAEVCAIVYQSQVVFTRTISVNITYTPLTADDFMDFMFPRPMVLRFNVEVQRDCAMYIVSNDTAFEGNETFMIQLNTNDPLVTLDPSLAIVTITDDNVLTIGFQESDYVLLETEATSPPLEVCVMIMEGMLDTTVQVNVVASPNSTAMASLDYSLPASTELTFDPETSTQCIPVSVIDDSEVEENETLILILTTTNPQISLDPSETVITVVSEDVPVEVVVLGFDPAEHAVSEDAGTLPACIVVGHNNITMTVELTVRSQDGTAITPRDYQLTESAPIMITSETVVQCVQFSVTDDSVVNGNKTFSLILNTTNDAVRFTDQIVSITIVDNDVLTIGFQESNYSVLETSSPPLEVCVMIMEGMLDTTVQVNVVASPNSTATVSLDYSLPASTELTFDPETSTQCVPVSVIDDSEVEENETLILSLTTTNPQITLDPSETVITVVSEDVPIEAVVLGFQRSDYIVDEDVGSFQSCIGVQHNNFTMDAQLTVESQDGTATTSVDYQLIDVPIIINPQTTIFCLDLIIIDDNIVDGNKTFTLVLNSTDDVVTFINQTTTITIVDNEEPIEVVVLGFEQTEYADPDSNTIFEACIVINHNNSTMTVELSVQNEDGTAISPTDYELLEPTILISPEATRRCIGLNIRDDSFVDGNKTFTLTLNSTTDIVRFINQTATLTIVDDDSAVIGFLNESEVVVSEGDESVLLSVGVLTGSLGINVRIQVLTQDETAIGGQDFDSSSQLLILNSTVTSVQVPILIIADSLFERDSESFIAMLQLVPPSDQLNITLNPNMTRILIEDDDPLFTIGFEQTSYTFAENVRGLQQICAVVSVAEGTMILGNETASLRLTVMDDTASDGDDYSFQSIMMTVTTSSSRVCSTINIIVDPVMEPPKTVRVFLNTDDPELVMFTERATNITIVDSIGFSVAPQSVDTFLNSGPVRFNCTSDPDLFISTLYWTVDGQQLNPEIGELRGISVSTVGGGEVGYSSVLSVDTIAGNEDVDVECVLIPVMSLNMLFADAELMLRAITVAFQMDSYPITESIGVFSPCVEILTTNLPRGTSVNLTLSAISVSAMETEDFVIDSSVVVTTSPSTGSLVCFNVTVLDDDIIEGPETFSLVVSSSDSYVLFNTSTAVITIMDNDVLMIGFESSSYAVNEASGTFQACVRVILPAGGLTSPISVLVTAVNDTASAPQDFNLSEPTSFSVNNNVTRFCVNVVIINNEQMEEEPSRDGITFNLTLSTSDSGVMFVNRTTVVSIHDDEVNPPVFSASGPTSSVLSGSTVLLQCNVTFLGGLRSPITFQWLNANGSVITDTSPGYVVSEPVEIENGATSQLNITSVLTSQAGPYTCRPTVDTIASGIIVQQSPVTITVQISPPLVFISSQSRDNTFNIGESTSFTCTISATDASTDIDVIPTIEWTVSYFENDRLVVNNFTATNLTAITPVVFSTQPLQFDPLLRSMTLSCRSRFAPGIDNDLISASGYGMATQEITTQALPVLVTTDPSAITIADISPYNTYSITCNVTLPSDVTSLRVDIIWQDAGSNQNLTLNGTISIQPTIVTQTKANVLYSSVITITESVVSGPAVLTRRCVANLSYVMMDENGMEDRSVPIASQFNITQVTVNGFVPPNPIDDFFVYGVSHELAIIEWCATLITYTPETYYVTYRERSEISTPIFIGEPISGTTNLSATNVVYRTVIEGLNASTTYSFSIVANNSNGDRELSTVSRRPMIFSTRSNGVYNAFPSAGVNVPLGAPIVFLFNFFDLFLSFVSSFELYPVDHVISPNAQFPDFSTSIEDSTVRASFGNASPSLNGTYVLCFEVVSPSRRRRTAELEEGEDRTTLECGGRVNISVSIPTLTISTDVLVHQYDGGQLVGDTVPQVTCTPSVPNAPVRWRTFLGVYGRLSSDFEPRLSPSGLNQVLSFPSQYEAATPPTRTEVLICDLVNVELSDGEEVAPLNVTVRFIQAPISILNNDREIPPNAVINEFSLGHPLGDPVLSLRCYSTEDNADLFWEAANVALLENGYISPEAVASVPNLDILTIGTRIQDTVLSINPVNNQTLGTYACRSRISNFTTEVLVTDINPFWMSRSPMFVEAPIGYVIDLSVLYADTSVGYMNFGTGFSYVFKFIPCVEILPDRVLLSGTTDSFGNELSYTFIAELDVQDGTYQINGTHKTSGQNYSDEIEVRVTEPFVADYDSIVYGLLGQIVTLRCIPNDTHAPILWRLRSFGVDSELPFLNLEEVPEGTFSLSPPERNHTVTFNTSLLVPSSSSPLPPPNDGPRARRQTFTPLLPTGPVSFLCGFRNGESTLAYNPTTVEFYIQSVNIQVQYLDGTTIVNNTVINRVDSETRLLPFSPFDKRSVGAPSDPQSSGISPDAIIIECITTQGNHLPLWRTDSDVLGDENGAVTCDEGPNRQVVTSNYTTELQFEGLSPIIRGTYTCQSQLIGPSYVFTISPLNPYLERVSPRIINAIVGDTVTLEFIIAVDSNGNVWSTPRTNFFFTSEEGETSRISFPTPSQNFPHNYVRVLSSVSLSDAGTYTASVPVLECGFEGEGGECGELDESITLMVTAFCPQEVGKGFFWPTTIEGSSVTLQCSDASPRFRRGLSTTRYCLDEGVWDDIDVSPCTLAENSDPFLLLWLILDTDELPTGTIVEENGVVTLDESTSKTLEFEMGLLLNGSSVSHSNVRIQSAYVASIEVVFDVTLSLPPSEQTSELLDFLDFFTSVLTSFGGYGVREGNRGTTGIAPAATCPCTNDANLVIEGSTTSAAFIELCSGVTQSPCLCNNSICECVPPFVGDGRRCTLDSDGDLYPDVALDSPTCTNADEGDIDRFCIPDNCPFVINPDQNQDACTPMQGFDGCPFEIDSQWDIMWPNTLRNTTNTQRCPGGLDIMGNATRYCDINGNWTVPVVTECRSPAFVDIQTQADALFTDEIAPEVLIAESSSLTMQLVVATTPRQDSLLPNDLLTSTTYINNIIDVFEENVNSTDVELDENLVDVFNNVLWVENTAGWLGLQASNTSVGSEALLDSSERYGLLLAQKQNNTQAEPMRLSRRRIVISAKQYEMKEDNKFEGLQFPKPEDLVNYTRDYVAAQIQVPPAYIAERMEQLGKNEGDTVPIVYILYNNIEGYLPSSLNNSNSTQSRSVVISAQVGERQAEKPSEVLQNAPVFLRFTFDEDTENDTNYACVTWNFSDPVGNGSWVTEGVTKRNNETVDGFTRVECVSNHLTSFAVLVDVGGGLQNITDAERRALQIVSYVGCGISVACLLVTVIFFLLQGKKLFNAVHFFVHLNLALSLLMAFTVFIFFIETVRGVPGLCAFIAALLHYLFLSAFCWMLCEGIMLYLLLVVVFSKAAKRWWMFLLIGYLTPLPFVIITVAARYQYYGVRNENGDLVYCWLSVDRGTIFGFVAPMLLIILINVVFLILALHSLWKTRRNRLTGRSKGRKDEKSRMKTTKTLFMASVVLLPLLGLTWAFGILTVNSNTTVFAWIFTILNSLQGVGILFFHVIRNDRVWSKIGPRLTTLKRSTLRSRVYSTSQSGTSTLKGGTYKSKTSSSRYEMGSLSRDSTLGRSNGAGTTKEKKDLSSTLHSISEYTSEATEETKIDLAAVEEARSETSEGQVDEKKIPLAKEDEVTAAESYSNPHAIKDDVSEQETETGEETSNKQTTDEKEVNNKPIASDDNVITNAGAHSKSAQAETDIKCKETRTESDSKEDEAVKSVKDKQDESDSEVIANPSTDDNVKTNTGEDSQTKTDYESDEGKKTGSKTVEGGDSTTAEVEVSHL